MTEPTSEDPAPKLERSKKLGEVVLERLVDIVRAHPRRALVTIAIVAYLAGRGAPPAAEEVTDLCVGVVGALVSP